MKIKTEIINQRRWAVLARAIAKEFKDKLDVVVDVKIETVKDGIELIISTDINSPAGDELSQDTDTEVGEMPSDVLHEVENPHFFIDS